MEKDGGCGQCSPAGMASVCHFYVVICGFITTGWAQRHNDVTPVLGCEDAQVGHQNVTAGTRHLQAPLLSCNSMKNWSWTAAQVMAVQLELLKQRNGKEQTLLR